MTTTTSNLCPLTSTESTKSVTGPQLGFLGALIVSDADADY